ncbi:MAG: outer membrane protein assembly factor BamA [Deltaproteobacteria bacterium]|nr:outer membrane protein assembly factor BamA [Deltaproteobacteria bacterium]
MALSLLKIYCRIKERLHYFAAFLLVMACILSVYPAYADTYAGGYNGMIISGITLQFPPDVKTEGIRELIKTKKGSPFSVVEADDSIKLIYSTGQCSDVQIGVEPAGNRVHLVYICKPVINVTKITFYGVKRVPLKDLEHAVFIQPETHFYPGLLEVVKEHTLRFYNDHGYMTVDVKVTFTQTSYNAVHLMIDITEGHPVRIKKIDITGNPEIKKSLLLGHLGIGPGDIAVKNKIDGIPALLESYYHARGYWQADVHKPSIVYSEDFLEAFITIPITAGPQYVLQFTGAGHMTDSELIDITGIKKSGGFINFELYKNRIENTFRDRGYYFCTVDYTMIKKKRIHVVFSIHRGRKVFIAGIYFSGNTHIRTSALKAQMLTSPWRMYAYIYNYKYNGILAPARFENDLKAIIYLYKINGFLNVRIKGVNLAFADARKEWINLTISLEEGIQTIVNSVSVQGVSESMNKRVMPLIEKIKMGGPFNMWGVQNIKRQVEQLYFSHGYINASVDYNYTIHDGQAAIEFKIKEGNRIRIGKIIIAGNIKTADWVIIKNLDFKTGMYFIPDNIIQSRINLLRTGYFESADIRPIPETRHKNVVDVAVIVKERKTRGVSVSIGYGTVEGYRAAVDVYDNNIMGSAKSIDLHAGGGVQPIIYALKPMFNHSNYLTNERDLELGYTQNYIFNTNMTGRVDLIDSYIRNFWRGYGLKTESGVVGIDRNEGSAVKLTLQYDFEIREPMDVQPGVILTPADFEQRQLGILSPIISVDERNNPFNPTNGYIQIFRLDWAKNWFLSQEEYVKIYSATTKYIPINNIVTYVLSLRGGYAWPLGTTIDLPIEKRFYLGGGSTIRGFAEDSVGPMGAGNLPIGGDIMLNYQTEFRVKLIDNFDGVVFTDGGNLWPSASGFELRGMHDIRKTAGFGIRYVTPAGALNLDIGFKLDKRPNEPLTAWNFYIGTIL